MNTPATLISSDFITIIIKNKPYTILSNDSRFIKLKEAIKNKAWDIVEQVVSLPSAIALFSSGKIKVFQNEIYYDGKIVHNSVSDRILEFAKEGFPFEPLVRFLEKLMTNPEQRSIEQLYNYLNIYKLPICEDGDFIAQKKVSNELKDLRTCSFDNSVGRIVEEDRALLDPNPENGCGRGLHVGSEDFVSSFGDKGVTILCKINPRDVVSIPFEANYAKMRVCRYEVIATLGEKNNDSQKFTSNYAPSSAVTNELTGIDFVANIMSLASELFEEEDEEDEVFLTKQDDTFVKNSRIIGANSAYLAYRNGQVVDNGFQKITPDQKVTRQYFRINKGNGWVILQSN
jgi:hypothetical protein